MPTASPVRGAVEILGQVHLPNGEIELIVPCEDYDVYRKLPAAVEFQGVFYGKAGWNSDIGNAYYRSGKTYAIAKEK